MVQVDISQLSAECNAWRAQLRNYRDELMQDEQQIRQVAGKPLSKDQLQEVEHLHNQFHIHRHQASIFVLSYECVVGN